MNSIQTNVQKLLTYPELLDLGIDVNKYKRELCWETGCSPNEAAVKIGQVREDFEFTVPVDEEDLVWKLHTNGHSARKIGKLLGCSNTKVSYILKKLKQEESL